MVRLKRMFSCSTTPICRRSHPGSSWADVDAVEHHLPLIRQIEALYELGQGRFAGAGWADDADLLARPDGERNILQRLKRARAAPTGAGQEPIWAVHVVSIEGETPLETEYETATAPVSLDEGEHHQCRRHWSRGAGLSGTTGPVLDPIFSIRRRFRLEAGGVLSMLMFELMPRRIESLFIEGLPENWKR